MSKTGKKITFNMMAGLVPEAEVKTLKYELGGQTFEMDVKSKLTFSEAMSLLGSVVGSCVDMGEGTYTPQAFELAKRYNTLVYYAGFSACKDVGKIYKVVFETDLYTCVCRMIDMRQHCDIMGWAMELMDYYRDVLVSIGGSQFSAMVARMNDTMEEGKSAIEELNTPEFIEKMNRMMAMTGAGEPVEEASDGDQGDS